MLVLLVATLMAGLAPTGCGGGAASSAPSAIALADIPGNYLQWIRAAASGYGVDWSVIAGTYSIESDFGRLNAPRVQSGENFAGAGGPGQFLKGTWERDGVDGDRDRLKDRYNPADAIPGTANLLRQNGAPGDYRRAIFAYNHASWYVDDVLSRAARYRGARGPDPSAVQFAAVADVALATGCASAATGPADVDTAARLTSPVAYRLLPGWAMAGGRPSEPVDARMYDDVLWVLRRDGIRVSAGREAGHHTHGDGTALDSVPAVGASQADWDATAGRLGTTSAGRRPAEAPAPGRCARSNRRSSGSATTATRATARHARAPAAARPTSTCRGSHRATARARSSRRVPGSWRSPCRPRPTELRATPATSGRPALLPAIAPRRRAVDRFDILDPTGGGGVAESCDRG